MNKQIIKSWKSYELEIDNIREKIKLLKEELNKYSYSRLWFDHYVRGQKKIKIDNYTKRLFEIKLQQKQYEEQEEKSIKQLKTDNFNYERRI